MSAFNIDEFHNALINISDAQYKNYIAKLIPNIDAKTIIGIRAPQLRKFIKNYFDAENINAFMNNLPHTYHEENLIHAALISDIDNYAECIAAIKKFLPYVDNWGVSDSFAPKIFKRHQRELEVEIINWLNADNEYSIRIGLLMLMKFYLDENFDVKYLEWAAAVKTDKYYAQMMLAWYFATALAKHYEEAVIYIEERRLNKWTHNKTIQKAIESYRISDEHKRYLKGLRI